MDVPLANLDRAFDYAVPAELSDTAQPGVRVKVRFAGRLRDGFVMERVEPGERIGLAPIEKVVSAEPVLKPQIAALIRDVADHYAGGFADVVRAAVPPRHAATEKATTSPRPQPEVSAGAPVLSCYPGSAGFLEALAAGGRPRAAWTVLPTPAIPGDWAAGFAEAAAVTLGQGRGALLIVPDAQHLERLQTACSTRFGAGSFAVLAADAGPSARYRSFLAAARGQARLVLGTRGAIFAPVAELGLIAVWDDGNDSYAEPHAPYWHAREVAALRAHRESSGLLLAAHNRTAEVQQLLTRSWLAPIQLSPAEARRQVAAIRPSAQTSARDVFAEVSRIPRDAFELIRVGLSAGPVLIQVPRAGYLPVLVCTTCRATARCPNCGQSLADASGSGAACRWCGPVLGGWRCPDCGGRQLRSPVVGVSRTAEELGKAFPGTAVVQSSGDRRLAQVPDWPALVLATPGATPDAEAGYSAAVLLDAESTLARPDLRAGEEALRRWLAAVAKVRPGSAGGTVLIVGQAGLREVQALVRLDPVGYAEAELAQRAEAGFPPAAKLVTIEGPSEALAAALSRLEPSDDVQAVGPFPLAGGASQELSRVTLRCPLSASPELVSALKELESVRSARKEAPLRIRVDPQVMD